jgi:hypothetical protein
MCYEYSETISVIGFFCEHAVLKYEENTYEEKGRKYYQRGRISGKHPEEKTAGENCQDEHDSSDHFMSPGNDQDNYEYKCRNVMHQKTGNLLLDRSISETIERKQDEKQDGQYG